MIRFTDPRLYVKGTCAALFANTQTGAVEYWTDKVQNFNEASSANEDLIRAGLGNGIATVLISDSEKTITASAADFSLKAKAMQLGGSVSYNGIAPVCQNVTASSATLTVDVEQGVPVANYGFSTPMCYVQEVGEQSPISQFGTAYEINPTSGEISGFTAQSGTVYKVWYFTRKTTALEATFYSNFQPGVYHVTFQLAVFRNMTGDDTNAGTRVGWLYCIYPRYKMTPGGGMVGDQTTADTTDLSGRALPMDSEIIGEACTDCDVGTTCYYIYVPDEGSEAIMGIMAAIGGTIDMAPGATYQVQPKFIMENGQIVKANDLTNFSFELTNVTATGTTVGASTGLITAGSTAGTAILQTTYQRGYPQLPLIDQCVVTVEQA